MSKEHHVHEITLPLDDIRYLFTDPEPDSTMFISGITWLYRQVRGLSRLAKLRIAIEVPPENFIAGDPTPEVKHKLECYCRFKIEESDQELVALHRQGRASLWMGLLVLLVCVILAWIFNVVAQLGTEKVLQGLLQIISVLFAASAGWVALWQPAEIFLYDWWPFREDIRIYKQLADAQLIVRAKSDALPV